MSQGNQSARFIQQRVGVLLLGSYVGCIGSRIHRQIQIGGIARRESEILVCIPLHRGTGSVAWLIGALYLWPVFRQLAHTDLIAIIEERNTRHCEPEGIDDFQFLICTLVA